MEGTFIKLDRKILKWEWFDDPYMFKTFIYLLLKANHKDGKWQGIEVKKGQVITGRLKLALALSFTERQVRTCLERLKMTNEISVKTTSKYSIITICKYDVYQNNKQAFDQQNDQQNDQQTTNKRPTNDQQATTNKNVKNNNNDKNVKNSNSADILKHSNLMRKPTIPDFEEVHRVFIQNGGTEIMAKTFYARNESVGWFLKGSPIINFSNLVPSYVDAWIKNTKKEKALNKGFIEVPENIDYDNLSLK